MLKTFVCMFICLTNGHPSNFLRSAVWTWFTNKHILLHHMLFEFFQLIKSFFAIFCLKYGLVKAIFYGMMQCSERQKCHFFASNFKKFSRGGGGGMPPDSLVMRDLGFCYSQILSYLISAHIFGNLFVEEVNVWSIRAYIDFLHVKTKRYFVTDAMVWLEAVTVNANIGVLLGTNNHNSPSLLKHCLNADACSLALV